MCVILSELDTDIIKPTKQLSKSTRNVYLSRASKSGRINRVKRGVYLSPVIHDKFVIANEAVKDGYIAFHSAMEYHGMNTSSPVCVKIASKKRFRLFHYDYNTFVRVPDIASAGINEYTTPEGKIECTSVTRTLVDCILRPELSGGVKELWNAFLILGPDDINYKELEQILSELGNKSLYQKVGYYFSHFKTQTGAPEGFLQLCRTKCQNVVSSIQSGPTKFNKEWKVVIPSELDEDKDKDIRHYITDEERKQILFLSSIIEEFKKTHHLTNEKALDLLDSKGILDWLNENWEILHTTGYQYIMQEIDEILGTR